MFSSNVTYMYIYIDIQKIHIYYIIIYIYKMYTYIHIQYMQYIDTHMFITSSLKAQGSMQKGARSVG